MTTPHQIANGTAEPPLKTATTVLVVTADQGLRAVVSRVLQREGYHVVSAAHAGHGLLAGLMHRRIDILISDVALDDTSGAAMADSLRRYHPAIRPLFLAAAGAARRDGVLVRPFTRDELLVELDALVTPAIS